VLEAVAKRGRRQDVLDNPAAPAEQFGQRDPRNGTVPEAVRRGQLGEGVA
jgi:hypothetical protein